MKNLLSSKILKIIASILYIAVGVLVVVFAIIRWANHGGDIDPTVAIRIVSAIGLFTMGLYIGIRALIERCDDIDFIPLVSASILVGAGCFFCFPISGDVMDVVVGLVMPLLLASVGLFLFVKSIVILARKLEKVAGIAYMIFGIIFLAVGIVFVIFRKDLVNLIWIIAGLSIAISGLGTLFNREPKIKQEPEQKPDEEK